MHYSKALRPLSVVEALAVAVCLIALPTVTEQQSQQQLLQPWKQKEGFFIEAVDGPCSSTTRASKAAASQNVSSMCCGKIRYRYSVRSSSSGSPVSRLPNYQCCKNDSRWGVIYDPEEAMCCGGKVVARDLSGDLRCCNGEAPYNVSTHICCVDDGLTFNEWQIHLRPSFAELHHSCCGKDLYNSLVQKCCSSVDGLDNRVHTIPHEEAQEIVPKLTACCGTAFNKTTSDHVCYNDDLIHVTILCAHSQGAEWNNDSHICCSGHVASKAGHICCEGVLHRVADGSRCCGSHYVNENEYLCCNGTAHPHHNSADIACCGSRVFNQSGQKCYNNEVRENYNGQQAVRCGKGDKAYFVDPLKHICCNGTVYLKMHNLCCNGKKYSRSDLRNESCCGSQKYDEATRSCTADKQVRLGAEAVMKCQSISYNPHEHICCEDRLLLRKSGNKCCGKRNYFENNPFVRCCNGKLQSYSKRTC